MRQILYVSDSLIGDDVHALDQIMIQARHNNAIDGITGLLWTDGKRFAQVIEGGEVAIAALVAKLRIDHRHSNFSIVQDGKVTERQFGGWSMTRPSTDSMAEIYEQRMRRQLSRIEGALSATFEQVIAGSGPAPAG